MLISCQRQLFDLCDGVAYLRCAAAAPLLREAQEAGHRGLLKRRNPWKLGHYEAFEEPEEVRALFARLIGASADEIALVPSVSYGIATAARNIPVRRAQKIVLLWQQFPSNVYAWQQVARREDAHVQFVQRIDGEWTTAVLDAIDESTAIVAVPQCHWLDGSVVDLAPVAQRCRAVGAALVLDLSQSLGACPFDVRVVRPDFIACTAEKWLLGPYQMAFLYVAPQWHEAKPLELNWIARRNSEDYSQLVDYCEEFQAGARRFDGGERSNNITLPIAAVALRQILEWGVDNVAQSIRPLVESAARIAESLELQCVAPAHRAAHMIGIRGANFTSLEKRLAAHGVYVNVRGDAIRVAPHVYNDFDDLDRFGTALRLELSR